MEVLALALWVGMIFAFSSVPRLSTGLPQDPLLRKLAHVAEFAVLTWLLWRILARRTVHRGHAHAAALLLGLAYALTDEVHQLYVPGRGGALVDVAIDAVGVVLGATAFSRAPKH